MNNLKIKYYDEEIDVFNEVLMVENITFTATLSKIPSLNRKIFIKHGYEDLTEVETEPNINEFKVDRNTGVILFNSGMAGERVIVDYSAIGKFCVSADNVSTNIDSNGNVIETLEGFMQKNKEIIDSVNTIGDGATVLNQLEAHIESAKNLTGNIIEGGTLNDKLVKTINNSKNADTNLKESINSANTKITEMDQWVSKHGDIVNLDNRVDVVETSIPKINEQLETKANLNEVVKRGNVDLDEMTERTLQAIQGGEGANFSLLSIPRDFSVNYAKTNFLEVGVNKMKPCINSQSGFDITVIENKINVYGTATKSDFIKIGEVGQLIRGEYTLYKKDVENPSGSNVMYLRGTNTLGEIVNIAELPKASESVTFSVNEDYTDVYLSFYASNTKSYVFKCYIQLNLGNSMMTYENYEETLKNSNYIKEGYLLNNYNLETPFLISNLGGNIITFNNGIIEVDNKLNYLFLITKKGDYIDISAIKGKNVNITEKTGLHFIYTDKINIYSYAYNQLPENKKDLYFLGSFYYNSTHKIVLSVNLNCKYSLNKNIINFIGDSLTYGYLDGNTRMELPYPALVENNLGCICNNYGISGTRISQTQDNAMSNDNRINSWDKSATCNIILGGTNDYLGGVPIGTLDDYKNGVYTTFMGGYEYLINKLFEIYKGKPLLLITPPQNWSLNVINGQNLIDFITAIEKIGEKYSLPVLDLYRKGGYCKANMKQSENTENALTTDGVHFTQYYVSNVLSPKVISYIKENVNF